MSGVIDAASRHHLQHTFGDALFLAAQRLADDGAVNELRVLQAGVVVTGAVGDGSSPLRHRVYIRRASAQAGAPIAEAECSCGQTNHCVHVAAVSIAAANTAVAAVANPQRVTPPGQRATSASLGTQLQQRLCYLLQAAGDGRHSELQLTVWVGQAPAGVSRIAPGNASPFVPRTVGSGNDYPRYVDAQDRQILQPLLAQRGDGPWTIRAAAGSAVLNQIIATKRAYWNSLDGSLLRTGKARTAKLSWQVLANGDQQLLCDVSLGEGAGSTRGLLDVPRTRPVSGSVALLALDPPMFIDPAGNECGEVTLPCSAELIRDYSHRTAVTPEEVAALNSANTPLPRLRTFSAVRQPLQSISGRIMLAAGPTASLYFVYNGLAADGASLHDSPAARILAGDVLYEVARDVASEQRLQSRFDSSLAGSTQGAEFWLNFTSATVPELQAQGWDVAIDDGFPYRLASATDWYADADTSRDAGWFDLKLGVTVDGSQVNLLPALVDYLQGALGNGEAGCRRVGEDLFVLLADGRYLPVPIHRIKRIADTLVELFEHDALDKHKALSLPVSQASRLAQLTIDAEAPQLRTSDPALLASIAELRNFTAIQPLRPPAQFNATLRPYQEEGLGWLQFLRRCRLGGILADDMGLGKTVQTLAHLALEKEQGRLTKPSLIIAPVSVIGNWQREIRELAPQLKQLTLHGARRRELFSSIRQADIVITAYPLLLMDTDVLTTHEFYLVVMDEAQMIKNPRAKVSQAARSLRAEHRLCLTGTPMENHLGELWALVDFLQPGLLGEEREFQRQYRTAIEKHGDGERAQALSRRIAPFVLRRTKDAVAPDLPAKTQIIETIALEEKQRDFYDGVRLASHRRIRETIEERGLARSQITVLDALLKLRQACCDPRLIGNEAVEQDIPSAKMDWLTHALPEMIEEGRRILLFSQFTSMLALIETTVQRLGIPYLKLTGETRERTPMIERFQAGAVPLFLISLKAGGTGLNLTAADTVIHYDPWWNPAVEAQATDRAHRIGQQKPVFVYKLIAQGTVEERIVRLQEQKHALASQLYTDKNAAPLQLNAADLEMLFAP